MSEPPGLLEVLTVYFGGVLRLQFPLEELISVEWFPYIVHEAGEAQPIVSVLGAASYVQTAISPSKSGADTSLARLQRKTYYLDLNLVWLCSLVL